MTITDPTVLPVAEGLLACLALQVAQLEKPPAHTMLRQGGQIELLLAQNRDECCEGLAWVRVAQVYPSLDAFPQPDTGLVARYESTLRYAGLFELGVARCAPMGSPTVIPSADDWNNVSAAVLADASAIRRAICCWLADHPHTLYQEQAWTPLPTEGGCVGGAQLLVVALEPCDCDSEEFGS